MAHSNASHMAVYLLTLAIAMTPYALVGTATVLLGRATHLMSKALRPRYPTGVLLRLAFMALLGTKAWRRLLTHGGIESAEQYAQRVRLPRRMLAVAVVIVLILLLSRWLPV